MRHPRSSIVDLLITVVPLGLVAIILIALQLGWAP